MPDGYIFATPIFQGSIPGVLKNALDFLNPKALRYKPVSIVANGGTHQHHLVVENQFKPILDLGWVSLWLRVPKIWSQEIRSPCIKNFSYVWVQSLCTEISLASHEMGCPFLELIQYSIMEKNFWRFLT